RAIAYSRTVIQAQARATDSYLVARRPPPPALFPYTTLFRSRVPARPDGGRAPTDRPRERLPSVAPHPVAAIEPGSCQGLPSHPVDRKSTRLNSSHVKISYAVFCLKKKKQ